MADLFTQRVETRENQLMTMRASAVVAFIDTTSKRLPRTVGLKWQHKFLDDIRGQLSGGYRATLSPKQVGHLLRAADHCGVDLPANGQGPNNHSNKEPEPWRINQTSPNLPRP